MTEICRILAGIGDARLIGRLLEELLTAGERRKITLRWQLVSMLAEGHSQRAIAKKLQVSLCKITRGSREMKKPGSVIKKLLTVKKKHKNKEIL